MSPGVTAIGYEFLMENAFMRGAWRESLEFVEQHRALAEKACSSDRLAWNFIGLTFARLGRGELAEAEASAAEGIELAARLGDERLETTLEAARKADMSHWEGMALKVRGQLHSAWGDEDAARKDFDRAIEIFQRLESRLELARALVLRAANEDHQRARDLFDACGATGDLASLDQSPCGLGGKSGIHEGGRLDVSPPPSP